MQDLYLNAYVMMFWSKLLVSATTQHALALEAGVTPLPVPMTPDVMLKAFVLHVAINGSGPGQNYQEFLSRLGEYVEDMRALYDNTTIRLLEAAAVRNGHLATTIKVEQHIQSIQEHGCRAQA